MDEKAKVSSVPGGEPAGERDAARPEDGDMDRLDATVDARDLAEEVNETSRETRRAENADQGAQEDGTQKPPPT
ncbi:MAG: hypothetical protein ABR562_05025 [Thermoplasmatota archaeon]